MDPSVLIGNTSSEVTVFSDSDWAEVKRNEKIVKRGSRARRTTLFESVHKKTKTSSPEALQKQNCMQQHWERQKQRVPMA